RVTGVAHVVTGRQFCARGGVRAEGIEFLYLDEMRQHISRWEQLRTLLAVRFLPGSIRRRVPQVQPEQHAVVLFTSGSERSPKAVPLTHRNLISEMRAGTPALQLTRG